jgi:protein-disulfide isomerase
MTRRERRAAERQDRFDAARDARRARTTTGGGTSSWFNTRTIMLGATVIGILIVVVVAANQLGGRVTGTLKDPGISYPAALLDGRTIGNADAPVTLEVWEDFQCPVCAKHSLTVEPFIVDKYVKTGVLRIVHNDLAFLGRGGADDESKLAASGAVCANQQGKYWDYSHWVYNNQDGENAGGFRRERLQQIAEAAGVDTTNWNACLDAAATVQEVADSTTEGVGLGVNSTPTMFIAGQTLVGLQTVEQLSAVIDAAVAAASPASSGAAASPAASGSTAP